MTESPLVEIDLLTLVGFKSELQTLKEEFQPEEHLADEPVLVNWLRLLLS